MSGSEDSAARFLAMRAPKIVRRVPESERLRRAAERAAKIKASRERSQGNRRIREIAGKSIPAPWGWVERRVPGAMMAWIRDVGMPTDGWLMATTGKPERAIAVCPDPTHGQRCLCREFIDGKWRIRDRVSP